MTLPPNLWKVVWGDCYGHANISFARPPAPVESVDRSFPAASTALSASEVDRSRSALIYSCSSSPSARGRRRLVALRRWPRGGLHGVSQSNQLIAKAYAQAIHSAKTIRAHPLRPLPLHRRVQPLLIPFPRLIDNDKE